MTRNGITRRRLAAMAVLLTLGGLAAAAAAQPANRAVGDGQTAVSAPCERDDARGPGAGPLARLARRLDLSDAQRDAIRKIETAARERDLPLRKDLRRLRHELRGEMMKDAPATRTVGDLARQIGDVRTKLQTGRLLDRLAVRTVLTPEQRDRLLMEGPGDGPGFGPRGGRGFRGGPGGWDGRDGHRAPRRGPGGPGRFDGPRRGPCGQAQGDGD